MERTLSASEGRSTGDGRTKSAVGADGRLRRSGRMLHSHRIVLNVGIEAHALEDRQLVGSVEIDFRSLDFLCGHECLAYPVRVVGNPNADALSF